MTRITTVCFLLVLLFFEQISKVQWQPCASTTCCTCKTMVHPTQEADCQNLAISGLDYKVLYFFLVVFWLIRVSWVRNSVMPLHHRWEIIFVGTDQNHVDTRKMGKFYRVEKKNWNILLLQQLTKMNVNWLEKRYKLFCSPIMCLIIINRFILPTILF